MVLVIGSVPAIGTLTLIEDKNMRTITIRAWNQLRKSAELIQHSQIHGTRIYQLIIKLSDGQYLAGDIEYRRPQAVVHTWTPQSSEFVI